jgi:hypothetical protein
MAAGAVKAGVSIFGKSGMLSGLKSFFFGSKLRTGLTLGTGALLLANNNRGGMPMSYAMNNPAMMQMAMYRGMPYGV